MTVSIAATITSTIGYWTVRNIPDAGEARVSYLFGSLGFFILVIITMGYYHSRHKKIIDELRKKNG